MDSLDYLPTEAIRRRIAEAEAVPMGEQWEEFAAEAASTHQTTLIRLQAALVPAEEQDRQRLAEEQARQEREAAERAEREQRIAVEAAQRARLAAEAEARQQAEAVARAAEAERLRLEREVLAAQKAERDARLVAEAEAREQAARLADTAHRANTHRQAAAAIAGVVATCDSEAHNIAKAVVTLIVRGGVPHVSLTY